jgi:CBS domain containing-hemolysin-like protein
MEFVSLLVALALVVANGFFVAVEFALVKVRPTQLEALRDQGNPAAAAALAMRQSLDTWLSAAQVGITLASLALGWIGEPAFEGLIGPVVQRLTPDGIGGEAIAKTIGVVLSFGTITFLHIVVGEQVPKILAISQAEQTAMTLAWPMRAFHFVFFPAIWILSIGTRAILRLLRMRESADHEHALSQEELKLILTTSADAGALNRSHAELLERAMSMVEKTARQVLVPGVLQHEQFRRHPRGRIQNHPQRGRCSSPDLR